MKKIFLYLFALSLLFNIYQYVNSNKIFDAKNKELDLAHKKNVIIRDSLKVDEQKLIDANYFSFEQNDKAQNFYDDYDFDVVMKNVENELMSLNHLSNGNPLVPYGPVNGNKFIINKMKIINHRWILADFYSGNLNGEVFIKYYYRGNAPTEFDTVETVLYPN